MFGVVGRQLDLCGRILSCLSRARDKAQFDVRWAETSVKIAPEAEIVNFYQIFQNLLQYKRGGVCFGDLNSAVFGRHFQMEYD